MGDIAIVGHMVGIASPSANLTKRLASGIVILVHMVWMPYWARAHLASVDTKCPANGGKSRIRAGDA